MFIQDDEFENIDSILDESIKEAENAYNNMIHHYTKQRQIVKYTKIDLFPIVYLEIFQILLKANLFLKLFI